MDQCESDPRAGRGLRRAASSIMPMKIMSIFLSVAVCLSIVGGGEGAKTAVFLLPVYEWNLIWQETRNPNYILGGIWR